MTLDPSLPIQVNGGAPTTPRVKLSMYTSIVDNGDGNHLLHNTLTGRFLKVPSSSVAFIVNDPLWVCLFAELNSFQRILFEQGFLVPDDAAEPSRSRMLYDRRYWSHSRLEFILLPHENCNFRCEYCYEIFARNKMLPWVRNAIKRFSVANVPLYKEFSVSWFGGEPTLADDVISELSQCFIDICTQHDVRYTSSITTNGYKLTDKLVRTLIDKCGITNFQVTLDGPRESHNKRRHLVSGADTFDQIYTNLLNMRSLDSLFEVTIRVNFDDENAEGLTHFIEQLARDFAPDKRFVVHPYPISNWGGDSVMTVPLCDANAAKLIRFDLLEAAAANGLSSLIRDEIQPLRSVCYAADPNSYIIGADGKIYKCTIAFEDPRNQVGVMTVDGRMQIDVDKFGLWVVNQGVTDSSCQSCFFNPACHGMTCPLYRMQTGQPPCPPLKRDFPKALRILAKELENENRLVQFADAPKPQR